MAKLKLKKGDSVYTIAGRDKGKTGKIIRILRSQKWGSSPLLTSWQNQQTSN